MAHLREILRCSQSTATRLFIALGVLSSPTAAAQLEDLGALPATHSTVAAVSADGRTMVGATGVGVNVRDAFVWTADGGFQLLDSGTATRSEAIDLSDDGRIAVGTWDERNIVVWDLVAGTTTELGTPPGFPFHVSVRVSGDGSTILSTNGPSAPGGPGAAVWVPGTGFTTIGTLGSSTLIYQAMSWDGSTIVGVTDSPTGGAIAGFVWTAATGARSLTGADAVESTAFDVSADGRFIVGYERKATGNANMVLWRDGIPFARLPATNMDYGNYRPHLSADGTTIAAQDPHDFSGQGGGSFRWTLATGKVPLHPTRNPAPKGISDDGSVIACTERIASSTYRALRWTTAGGLEKLEDYGSADASASFVAADGGMIVGAASRPDGRTHASRWRSNGVIGSTYCSPAVPNSTGAPARISLGGSNVADHGRLVLRARQLPPGALGFFLVSSQPGLVTTILGSQGTLCLSGPIGRYVGPGQVLSANAAGEMSLAIDPAAMAGPTGPVTPTFGQAFYFQAWFRDANPQSTSNLTDAAAVRLY